MAKSSTTQAPTATVVVGAGAPHSPLMSGFFAAVYDAGKTFNNFFTAGGGGLIGLSLVAPKRADPRENVEGILDCAVADPIYKRMPINYKVFRKKSRFLEPMQKLFNMYKVFGNRLPPAAKRLYDDLIDLGVVMAAPGGTPRPDDNSMCAPFALLPHVVDFDKLEDFTGTYYLNAYNINTGRLELFSNRAVTDRRKLNAERFAAALAYPFIYPPGEVVGKDGEKTFYYEGADIDPLCLLELMKVVKGDLPFFEDDVRFFPENHTIVLLDVLGSLERSIVRLSKGLWDAYGISMLTPIVSCARWSKALFRERHMIEGSRKDLASHGLGHDVAGSQHARDEAGIIGHHEIGHRFANRPSWRYEVSPDPTEKPRRKYDMFEIRFQIGKDHEEALIDWSYENLKYCFDLGLQTGRDWLDTVDPKSKTKYRDLLPDRAHGHTVNACEPGDTPAEPKIH